MLSVETIINGKWKQNCYLIHNPEKQALIIDPGSEAGRVIQTINEQEIHPLAILNTHAHYDHIGAIMALKEHFDIPLYLHSKARKTLKYANLTRSLFDGDSPIEVPKADVHYDEVEQPIQLGTFQVQVLETPGHSPEGISLCLEECLFTGDTLFANAVGRLDLPGGKAEDLRQSLQMLSDLDPAMFVYPGHGRYGMTLESILESNAALKEILADEH